MYGGVCRQHFISGCGEVREVVIVIASCNRNQLHLPAAVWDPAYPKKSVCRRGVMLVREQIKGGCRGGIDDGVSFGNVPASTILEGIERHEVQKTVSHDDKIRLEARDRK